MHHLHHVRGEINPSDSHVRAVQGGMVQAFSGDAQRSAQPLDDQPGAQPHPAQEVLRHLHADHAADPALEQGRDCVSGREELLFQRRAGPSVHGVSLVQ